MSLPHPRPCISVAKFQRIQRSRKLFFEPLEIRSLLAADVAGGASFDASLDGHSHDNELSPPLITQFHHFNSAGYLTGPASGTPVAIALDYLRSHADQFEVTTADFDEVNVWTNYVTDTTGVTHLSFRQMLNGLEVDGANFNANVARDGSLINVAGGFVRDIARFDTDTVTPEIDALKAAGLAAPQLGLAPSQSFAYLDDPTERRRR